MKKYLNIFPKYNGTNIINLISSIGYNFGYKNKIHKNLDYMPEKFYTSKNVILFVIDGLGHNFFLKNSKILNKYLINKIETVFPTTTTAAISTFNTGLTPYEHSLISWYMNLKEIGTNGIILSNHTSMNLEIQDNIPGFCKKYDLFGVKTIYEKIKADSYIFQNRQYKNSKYSNFISKGTKKQIYFKNLDDGINKLKKILKLNNKKYIYFYYGELDTNIHNNGGESKKSINFFEEIEIKINKFINQTKDVSIIITGDHGHITSSKKERINLNIFKEFDKLLVIKPTGDSRMLSLFIRMGKEKDFLNYFEKYMKKYFYKFSFDEFTKLKLFGFGKIGDKFYERVGDYILICKERYTIGNFLINEEEDYHISSHSGLSEDELYVPFIFCNKS